MRAKGGCRHEPSNSTLSHSMAMRNAHDQQSGHDADEDGENEKQAVSPGRSYVLDLGVG